MSKKILTPKFLTYELTHQVTIRVLETVEQIIGNELSCHIVVLVPSMKDEREEGYPSYPNYPIEAFVIYDASFGEVNGWKYPFDDIAKCKALQLWHGRNDGRTDCMPHLLFPGDTPYWGGVKRDEIVVGCSGFESHIDRMISGMIADMCIGMSYDALYKLECLEHFNDDFIS